MEFKAIKDAACALALAGATSTVAGSAIAETELTFGSPFPENHMMHEAALRPFFERVLAATDGELTWELFAGGSMGGPLEALNGVGSGVIDSGVVMDLYFKSEMPVSVAVANLFAVADDLKVFVAAANDTMLTDCPQCDAERDKHNIKGLAYYGSGPYILMCTRPVSTLADLQGVKVRASTRMGALMQHMGATPVSITSAEMYEAMQRGQAECTVGGASWLTSYGIKDVVTSIVDLPLGVYYSGLMMNVTLDRWEGLSEGERQAVVDNLPALVADVIWGETETADDAIADAVSEGAKVVEPGEDLKASLEEFRKGELSFAIETGTDAGVENVEALMNKFLENVEKWRGIVAATEDDKAAFTEALDREIFSQLAI